MFENTEVCKRLKKDSVLIMAKARTLVNMSSHVSVPLDMEMLFSCSQASLADCRMSLFNRLNCERCAKQKSEFCCKSAH
jgi:hypothetical protein